MLDNELTILEKAFIHVDYDRMMKKVQDELKINHELVTYLTIANMITSKLIP